MTNGHREISASEVLEWSRTDTPMVRVETARDELPGGLAMAMAPLMVHWNASSLGFGANDYYLVHNVNVFSNPIEGTTTLATVRVPAAGVESIEFVMVLSKVAKTQTEFGHAQLRFIFEAKKRPVILSIEGKPIPHRAEMKDLVLSWEAWRSPGASFDPVAGLDPQRYALSLRCFNGSVRYMSDSLFERPWTCYPIQLPDLPNAANEFLYVGLLLGDAVARQTIFGLLDRQIEAGRNMPEDYSEPEASEWAEVKDAIKRENLPDDSIRDMLSGNRFGNGGLSRSKHLHGLLHPLDRDFGDHHRRRFDCQVGSQHGQQIRVSFALRGKCVGKRGPDRPVFIADHQVNMGNLVVCPGKCFTDIHRHRGSPNLSE